MRQGRAGGEVNQCAVRLAPMVFAPRAFPREGGEVRSSYVMVMAELAAPQSREVGLGPVG